MNTQTVQPVSGTKAVVEALRTEAAKNPAFNAVCHIFALRERARQQVTINSLSITMAKEGFSVTKSQCEDIIKFMASIKLGTLDFDLKGRLRALKNIKVTLQSIGLAAISRKDDLEKYHLTPVFGTLPMPAVVTPPAEAIIKAQAIKKQAEEEANRAKRSERSYPASLVVTFETEQQTFNIPSGLTSKQLGTLLAELFNKKV